MYFANCCFNGCTEQSRKDSVRKSKQLLGNNSAARPSIQLWEPSSTSLLFISPGLWQVHASISVFTCSTTFQIKGLCPILNNNWFCHICLYTPASPSVPEGIYVTEGTLFWGCTSCGVYVPCIYSHARWELPQATQVFVVLFYVFRALINSLVCRLCYPTHTDKVSFGHTRTHQNIPCFNCTTLGEVSPTWIIGCPQVEAAIFFTMVHFMILSFHNNVDCNHKPSKLT